MPLIKPVSTETVGIRIKFPKQLDIQIKAYMQWVGVDEIDLFLQQAAEYILQHDRQWKAHQHRQ